MNFRFVQSMLNDDIYNYIPIMYKLYITNLLFINFNIAINQRSNEICEAGREKGWWSKPF